MNNVYDFLSLSNVAAKLENNKQENQEHERLHKEGISTINKIFIELKIHCPNMRLSFPTQDEYDLAKQVWVNTFIKLNVIPEIIEIALSKIRASGLKYMISPGEFIELGVQKRAVKPLSDTTDKELLALPQLEKERRIEYGKSQIKNLKDLLK